MITPALITVSVFAGALLLFCIAVAVGKWLKWRGRGGWLL